MVADLGLVLQLGYFDLLLPLIAWEALSLAVTVVGGLLAFRWCRARLRASGRSLGLATGLIAPLAFAIVPVGGGYFAAMFSLHRSVAAMLDDAGPKLVDWTIEHGAKAARLELGIAGHETVV